MREIVHHSSLLHPFVVALKEVLLTDQVGAPAGAGAAWGGAAVQ